MPSKHPDLLVLQSMLERTGAKVTASELKLLILGALTSPDVSRGPMQLMPFIWDSEPQLGDTLEEVNANFAILAQLWNALAVDRPDDDRFLSRIDLSEPFTEDKLRDSVARCEKELQCFINGFGDQRVITAYPEEVDRMFRDLDGFFDPIKAKFPLSGAASLVALQDFADDLKDATDEAEELIDALLAIAEAARAASFGAVRSDRM